MKTFTLILAFFFFLNLEEPQPTIEDIKITNNEVILQQNKLDNLISKIESQQVEKAIILNQTR